MCHWKEAMSYRKVCLQDQNVEQVSVENVLVRINDGDPVHPNAGKISYSYERECYSVTNEHTATQLEDLAKREVAQALQTLNVADVGWK